MIVLEDDFIYEIINNHLYIIVDNDVVKTYDNIKLVTIGLHYYFQEQYETFNEFIFITENDFLKALGSYFTDFESSQIGRLIAFLISGGDVVLGTAVSTGSGVSSFLTTSLTPFIGSTSAALFTGLMPLLLLILIFGFYKYIKTRDVYNVKIIISSINKMSRTLRFKIPEKINTEFKNLIKNRCGTIKERKDRLDCAITGYVKYLNQYVLVDLVKKYVKYLKDNNENLSEINSFNQLARYKSTTNKVLSSHMNKFYFAYVRFLKSISINKSVVSDSFHLLNKTTEKSLRE